MCNLKYFRHPWYGIHNICRESKIGGCTAHHVWSPTTSIDKVSINHFVVMFAGISKRVENRGDYAYMMEQSLSSCDSHNITIIAVDI